MRSVGAGVGLHDWLRSEFVFDSFYVQFDRNHFDLESKRSSLCFTWINSNDVWDLPLWTTFDPSFKGIELDGFYSYWDWQFGEFGYLAVSGDYTKGLRVIGPYWSMTIPLTLLSAYLITLKPRKRSTSDQAANTTADCACADT